MQVRVVPVLGWLLAACAAPADPPPPAGACPSVSTVPPAGDPSRAMALEEPKGSELPVPADAADAEFERERREALVQAADPMVPALELAAWLAANERHEEALAVVRAAWRRCNAPALLVAAAGLQRDLGRRHEAVATLLAVVAEQTVAACHPGLVFELAELQWLEGDGKAAASTLQALEASHGQQPWWLDRQAEVSALRREIAHGGVPRAIAVRDVLGNLRGARDPAERLRCLRELIATGAGTRAQAVAIGVGDADELVRAQAVLAAEVDSAALVELSRGALADPAPPVRAAGAARVAELTAGVAMPLLRAALLGEDAAAPLLAMHQALRNFQPDGPTAAVGELATAAGRRQLRQAWEALWTR